MSRCEHCASRAVVTALTVEGAHDLCDRHSAAARALAAVRVVILIEHEVTR